MKRPTLTTAIATLALLISAPVAFAATQPKIGYEISNSKGQPYEVCTEIKLTSFYRCKVQALDDTGNATTSRQFRGQKDMTRRIIFTPKAETVCILTYNGIFD